jgi:outer membrane protein assembly factor BamB
VVAVVDGERLLIAAAGDGAICAMRVRTGERVWSFQLSKRGLNSSVVVDGYKVYATHSEENHDSTSMGRVVCIDARGRGDVTETHEIWRQDDITAGYASPVLNGGRLYVMNNSGVLYCYDAEKGQEIWRYTVERVSKGSPIWADGKLYIPTVNGTFTILEDTGDEARLLDSMTFESDKGGVELFGSPAVADGRVVFFTTEEILCLGTRDAGKQAVQLPATPQETPGDPNSPPASIQVRPAEILTMPGEKTQFKVVAFDAKGRPLGDVDNVTWSYQGPGGSVKADGAFDAASNAGSIGIVTAVSGDLETAARVRIVPDLPITEDFESFEPGQMLSWWIGVSKAKHAIETIDGSRVLTKLADDRGPAFNRSRVYITPPLKTGYTVQADVMGTQRGRLRGDVGLINARYRLELFGSLQRLRVISWVPGPRFEKRMDFSWDPDRWYTIKFRVDLADGKAYPRVKVWPRDEAEPENWTLEGEDPQPNLEGSAGIYGFSMTPLHYDNVRIYR